MKLFRLKRSVILLLVLLLSLGSAFPAFAASTLKVTSSVEPDGTKRTHLDTVVEVSQADYESMMGSGITFVLEDANGQQVGEPILRTIAPAEYTVTDAVYSIPVELSFAKLQPGTTYQLKASYTGADGQVRSMEQPVNILPTGYTFVVKHTPKGASSPLVAPDNSVRFDDDQVTITILDEYGNKVSNKNVLVQWTRGYQTPVTTDQEGQIVLIGPGSFFTSYGPDPVVMVMVDPNTPTYAVGAVYFQDQLDEIYPNHQVTELRYLDKDSRLITSASNRISPKGKFLSWYPYSVAGVDVMITKGEWSHFERIIESSDSKTAYVYSLNSDGLTPEDGKRKTIILNAQAYSHVTVDFSWDSQPVAVKDIHLTTTSGSRQISRQYDGDSLLSGVKSLYVPKGRTDDYLVTLDLPSGDQAVVKKQLTTSGPEHALGEDLKSDGFSAFGFNTAYKNTSDQSLIRLGYMNDSLNYHEIMVVLNKDTQLHVPKNERIYKLNAAMNSNRDDFIVESLFTPTDSSYTFNSGSVIRSNLKAHVENNDGSGPAEELTQLILGESANFELDIADDQGHAADLSNMVLADISRDGQLVASDQYMSRRFPEDKSKLKINYGLYYKPSDAGNYTVSFKLVRSPGEGDVTELGSKSFTVLPRHELEVEIRDGNGALVDLVNKPFLTTDQATSLTFTVREHTTGEIGNPIKGATISQNGNKLPGQTDEQGTLKFLSIKESRLEYTISAPGYVRRTIKLQIIDPKREAIIRVSGLDKAELGSGLNLPGGVPLQDAMVIVRVKDSQGRMLNFEDYLYGEDDTTSYLAVPSPSVINVDYIRGTQVNTGKAGSPFGYYMLGTLSTEPGKDYRLALDARQPMQQLATVQLSD